MAADAAQSAAPAPVGDLPQTQSAESSALSPTEVDIEAQTVWDVIGVHVVPASFPRLESFDRGAKISDIRPDSPAAKAGWNAGDILIGLDAFQMTSLSDLYYVATDPQLDPKTPLPTKILAKGTVQSGTIRLAPKP
jgi:S1-C subfamily serine protease